jgi:hypothetical protein
MLKKLIDDSHVTLFMGIMIVLFGVIDGGRTFLTTICGFKIGSTAVIVGLGIFNILLAVVFIIMGARNIEVAEDVIHGGKAAGAPGPLECRIAELERRLVILEKGKPEA